MNSRGIWREKLFGSLYTGDEFRRFTGMVLEEKNEAFSKNNRDKTTNSIPSQKADHVGSSQNKKSYASSLNGDRDSKTLLTKEGFLDVKLTYLGGMWVMIKLDNEASKLELLQHIGVNSWFHVLRAAIHDFADNILEKFKVIFKRKVYMAHAKELFAWTLIFLDHKVSEYISDDESLHGAKDRSVGSQHGEDDLVDDSDVKGVPETFFGDKHPSPNNSVCNSSEKVVEQQSEDPFCIYDVPNEKPKGVAQDSDSSFSHPPGFTPEEVHENVTSNEESAFNYSHNAHNGGLILEVLDDMIRIMARFRFVFIILGLSGTGLSWINYKKLQQSGAINSIKDDLIDVDKNLDSENVSDEILLKRMELTRQLHDINQMEAKDYVQKSKIKWAIEGDENSKFFHGIINKKRSQLSIRGVFVDGDWNTDPEVVKDVIKDHFATRFKQPDHGRLKLNISFPNRLSIYQVADMDRSVSMDEIHVAVWNCGENKSPGPDGYTFEFFRRYWRFIGSDFCSAVESFFESGSFSKGSNSTFIALILKVTDAKFVTDFRPISLIGCVYKVVTKILANRLATVISDLIFDIQSAVVANRQILDGPFILNELLAWCKRKKKQDMIFKVDFAKAATSDGLFKGIQIQGSMAISHLFYTDDVVFIREWSDSNLDNIVKILKCFFLASGLKFNIQKSQVLGVGVPRNIVNQAASLIGYVVMQNPFRYLGVMVGDSMSRKLAWADTVQKLRSRKITWVSWDKILASKKNGGLGISSFHALNLALLLKWVWRFLSQDGSLWYRVIQALYGASFELHPVNLSSIWCSILCEMQVLISKETDKDSTVASKFGSSSVDASFRRSVCDGLERQQWDDLNSVSGSVTLFASKDIWICDLNGDGVFRVKEVRTILDDIFLPSAADATRWVKYIPIKINVFAWHARLDRLPTRSNLVRRGVVLDSYLCSLCGLVPEDIHHVLFRCDTAKLVFRRICRWWDLD
nr:RNA-directed DNA polymerase, eukaryota [Tanacetum cinerariifolium]